MYRLFFTMTVLCINCSWMGFMSQIQFSYFLVLINILWLFRKTKHRNWILLGGFILLKVSGEPSLRSASGNNSTKVAWLVTEKGENETQVSKFLLMLYYIMTNDTGWLLQTFLQVQIPPSNICPSFSVIVTGSVHKQGENYHDYKMLDA